MLFPSIVYSEREKRFVIRETGERRQRKEIQLTLAKRMEEIEIMANGTHRKKNQKMR
jgi:hypothetical protein